MIVDPLLIFALIVCGGLHLVLVFFLSYLRSYLVLHPRELVALI